MERLFDAECPACHGRFVCHYGEMRHSGVALFCPYCRQRFLPEDAADLDERWETSEKSGAPDAG